MSGSITQESIITALNCIGRRHINCKDYDRDYIEGVRVYTMIVPVADAALAVANSPAGDESFLGSKVLSSKLVKIPFHTIVFRNENCSSPDEQI